MGEALDVVVLVAILAFVEGAVVVSKKLGPDMNGSSSSSASLAERRGISCLGWAGR